MAIVHLRKQHKLNEDEVRKQVEELADKLATQLSASYEWRDTRLEFKRRGAKGYLLQKEGEVEVYIKLGTLLSPLKGSIEKTVASYLDDKLH